MAGLELPCHFFYLTVMKKRFIFFIALLFTFPSIAQQRVLFTSGGTGVASLGFQLTACDKSQGYTTDADGRATLTIPKGCTALRIQFQDITYGNFDSVFQITTPPQELHIQLTEKQTTIDEVRVAGYVSNIKETARGREYKINTEKFATNTPIPKALQRLPDFVRSGEGVVIAGKTGVPTYYLDDKEVSETIIRTLNIQSVERVEVRDVSADPSKDGGEIRIYRKKTNATFVNGRISLSGRYELNRDDRFGYSTAPSLNFQSPRFEANATGRFIRSENNFRIYKQYQRTGVADSISETLDKQSNIDGDAMLRLSYLFSESFSAQFIGNVIAYNSSQRTNSYLDKDYYSKLRFDELEGSGALILRYAYSKDSRFYLKGSYYNVGSNSHLQEYNRDYRLKQNDYTAAGELSGEHNKLFTLWHITHSIDYAYRYILRGGSTEGVLSPKSHTQRIFLQDFLDLPFSISVMVGCAVDYDVYDYGIQQLSLWNVLPTASAGYGGTWGRVTLTYSQRVGKPNIGYLDPRVRYSDHRTGTIGNQSLLPATYHSYSLRYSKRFSGHAFSFRVEYLDVRDYVSALYENNDFVSKYYNVGTMQRIAPRISYQGDYFEGKLYINAYGGVNYTEYGFYTTYLALSRGKAQKGWNTLANISIEYSPNRHFTAETWLGHWGRGYQLYSYSDPVPDLGISLSYAFLKNEAMRVSVSASDLLNFGMKSDYRRELYSFIESHEGQHYPSLSLRIEYEFGRRFRSRYVGRELEIDDQLDRLR